MTDHAHGGAGHEHTPIAPGSLRARQRRVLWLVVALNGAVLAVEIAGGIVFGSLALLADAAHQASDVLGLVIAAGAHQLLTRPSSNRHTYGLQRADVLGAQANGVLLVAAAGWIMVEAVRRLGDPPEVAGIGLTVVALAGVAVNGVSAVIVGRVRGSSLNMRGAWLHLLADAGASLAAVAAGVLVITTGSDWADPAISLLIGALVIWTAWSLLRETTHVLLEGAPAEIDADEVRDTIAGVDRVAEVHHLHIWSLASDVPALSAHVLVDAEPTLHEAQVVGEQVRSLLDERHGIGHATLELECHPCDD